MTWYNSNWKSRYPVAIDILGGAESSAALDITLTVPTDFDDFWNGIRADGFDIIITDAMGTLQTFRRLSYTYSTRTLTLTGQSITFANQNSINVLYIYYNNPDQASDLQSAFSASSPKVGKIYLNAPSLRTVSDPIPRNGATTPNDTFQKTVDEEVYIWFRVKSLMGSRLLSYNNKLDFEAPDYIQIQSLDSAGSNDANRYTENLTAIIPGWVGVYVKAGSNSTDYTLNLIIRTVATNTNQTLTPRALLQVRNLLPT
jgi:hypothetical protein